jgi:hypothetical protein
VEREEDRLPRSSAVEMPAGGADVWWRAWSPRWRERMTENSRGAWCCGEVNFLERCVGSPPLGASSTDGRPMPKTTGAREYL